MKNINADHVVRLLPGAGRRFIQAIKAALSQMSKADAPRLTAVIESMPIFRVRGGNVQLHRVAYYHGQHPAPWQKSLPVFAHGRKDREVSTEEPKCLALIGVTDQVRVVIHAWAHWPTEEEVLTELKKCSRKRYQSVAAACFTVTTAEELHIRLS